MSEQSWQTFADPKFDLTFQYPAATPEGDVVEMDEIRVHFQSKPNRGFYLEIARYLQTLPQTIYKRECAFLVERFPGVSISELQASAIAGYPAFEFSFRWSEGERTVVLFEKQNMLYRVIYDPRQPLTVQAVATLRIV